MASLLPTDIYGGLNQVNVMDPIKAAQAQALLEQTRLKNQGIPAENERTILENLGIPARNEQVGYQNEALQLANKKSAAEMPDVIEQNAIKTITDKLGIPAQKLGAENANMGLSFLDRLRGILNGGQAQPAAQPQQEMDGQGPLMKFVNPAPQSVGTQAAGSALHQMVNPQQPQAGGLEGMSLDQLRQLDMQSKQAGGAGSQIIGPALAMRMQAEKKAMYDDLASPQWAAKIQALGTKNTNASTAFNEFRRTHPIIDLLPESEQKAIQQESFKANAQPNMAMMMGAPIPDSNLDSAAKRIANRESTVSEEMSKGFNRRPDAFQIHDALVNKIKAADPTFTEQDTEAGAAFAKNAATRRYVAAIDNARSTAARIAELTKKNAGTPSPALNELINKFKTQAGDLDAAKTAIGQIAGTEEYSGAFTRSGGGSETTRGWADELGKLIYQNPKQAAASSGELLRAFDRNRQALMKQGGGYIKKPDYQFMPDEETTKAAPQAGSIVSHTDGTKWKFKGGDPGKPESWEKQ